MIEKYHYFKLFSVTDNKYTYVKRHYEGDNKKKDAIYLNRTLGINGTLSAAAAVGSSGS